MSEKVGELCTRGYSTMLGYWGDDERTQEVIQQLVRLSLFF